MTVVSAPYTITKPTAVMIKLFDTIVASSTVGTARRTKTETSKTKAKSYQMTFDKYCCSLVIKKLHFF